MEGNETNATAQYTWEGILNAYIVEDVPGQRTTVPHGNPRFELIARSIAEGTCSLMQPDFAFAYEVIGQDGAITGHDTKVGFVPIDADNALRKLFEEGKQRGMIEDKGRACKIQLPRCSHIKFCVFFPRPWPHLAGPVKATWRYRSSPTAGWKSIKVRLSNHPAEAANPIMAFLSFLKVDVSREIPNIGEPLQKGVLEVEFDIEDLWSLYRSERAIGFGLFHDSIEDQLKLSLRRSGRRKTPDTSTLIQLASQFLRRPVLDIANEIATEFNREYGGHVVGFAREEDLQEQHLCLLVNGEDDRHNLLQWGGSRSRGFSLEDVWILREDGERDKAVLSFSALKSRLHALIDAGFTPEAISVANGFFELLCRNVLSSLIAADADASLVVRENISFGYDRCRNVLGAAIAIAPEGGQKVMATDLLAVLGRIYKARNAYMHGLRLRDHDFTRSVDVTREGRGLLTSLLDVWETRQLAQLIAELSSHGAEFVGSDGVEIALAKVREFMKAENVQHDGEPGR